jgi:hypothetical protein
MRRGGGGWFRPAGDSAGGTACPHMGGVRVADARDLAGGERRREERGTGCVGRPGVGRA